VHQHRAHRRCDAAQALSVYQEDDFLALRALLRQCDVGFTNSETLFHDFEDAPGYWTGTHMRSDPALLDHLKWMGVNLMGCANNHAYDFGENGVMTNLRNLRRAGIAHAGTGENMAAASAPVYLETAKGRVAMISATSPHLNAMAVRAGDQRPDFRGRPGANVIGYTTEWMVDEASFSALQRISQGLGWDATVRATASDGYFEVLVDSDERIHLLDQNAAEVSASRFIKSNRFGKRSHIDQDDLERNLTQVREAKRMADWVVFSMHAHEHGENRTDVADHIRALAHAVIDAGADIFVGHGPHEDRGIEIHAGKPIFYSLGNFILQNDTVVPQPHRSYKFMNLGWDATPADFYDRRSANGTRGQSVMPSKWESFAAVVTFRDGRLDGVALHPLDLGFKRARWQQGRPMLARGAVAKSVIDRIETLSRPFGTRIGMENGVGVIRPEAGASR
jgi:poly-gamma-glutamate synthesis protein (capsule biosynthesis protein)